MKCGCVAVEHCMRLLHLRLRIAHALINEFLNLVLRSLHVGGGARDLGKRLRTSKEHEPSAPGLIRPERFQLGIKPGVGRLTDDQHNIVCTECSAYVLNSWEDK